MKSRMLIALGLGAVFLGASGMANAGVSFGVNVGLPVPVYVAPAPVYAPPPPTYIAYQPAPVVAPVVVIGWHGGQYWDGHRWWSHHDWNARRHW